MQNKFLISILLLALAGCSQPQHDERERLFSDGWKFVRDSIPGAELPGFDDTQWMSVDLPHDYSLMALPGGDTDEQIGPFSKLSPGGTQTGHIMGGTGWYRKTFRTSKADKGKSFTLVFDGAYMETDVWVNGQKVGDNKYGYSPFGFDITPVLNEAGKENVVSVKVDNLGRNARWYSGSGLYRDVKLIVTDPVHVDLWGAYITTPTVTIESADVDVQITLRNDLQTEASPAVGKAEYVEGKEDFVIFNHQNMAGMLKGVQPEKFFDMVNSLYTNPTWPKYISWCGDIDIIGEKKSQGRYRDVLWDESVIELHVHEPYPAGMIERMSAWGWSQEYDSWTWDGCEGKPLRVRALTKAQQVRLELNGEIVGEKTLTEADRYIAEFSVPYQPGTLIAIALSDGQEIGRKELTTTGKAVAVQLTIDRSELEASRSDLAFIRIDAVDENGNTVQTEEHTVEITVTGDGELAASGNASIDDMKSLNRTSVRLYRGQAQAIVRPFAKSGNVEVKVSSPGLLDGNLTIAVK